MSWTVIIRENQDGKCEPGLWITDENGKQHLLDRDEVLELVNRLHRWLNTGRLAADEPRKKGLMGWTIEYDNHGDGLFSEWWNVLDEAGECVARCNTKETAKQIVALLEGTV